MRREGQVGFSTGQRFTLHACGVVAAIGGGGGLRERLGEHLGLGVDLSRSSLRRNVAEHVLKLLVLATTREEHSEVTGPPWPLTRSEVQLFANGDLVLRRLERIENGA
jgi:hypothetical protein